MVVIPFWKILYKPRHVGSLSIAEPRWLIAFGFLAILSGILFYLQSPLTIQETLDHLPLSASPEDRLAVRQALEGDVGVQCAFLPVRLFAGIACFSLVLFLVMRTWHSPSYVRVKSVFTVVLCSETILLFGRSVKIGSSLFGGPSGGTGQWMGMQLILQPADYLLRAFVGSLDIFLLWYLLALSIALQTLYGIHYWKALLSAFLVWGSAALSNLAWLWALRDRFHFLL